MFDLKLLGLWAICLMYSLREGKFPIFITRYHFEGALIIFLCLFYCSQTGIPIEEVPLLSVLEQAVATGDDHERVCECCLYRLVTRGLLRGGGG